MVTRIGGLASGMDIDSIVKDMMKAQRIPLDKLKQQKQIAEWQRDDYRNMNKTLKEFDDYIFANMTLEKDLLKKKVTSSDTSAVTATANASAANLNMNIQVTNVAKSATWISSKTDAAATFGANKTIKLSVTNGDGSQAKVTNGGVATTTIEIEIAATDKVDDILKKLSDKKELGITAFRDAKSGQVVITKKDTGEQANIKLDNQESVDVFNFLGFEKDDSGNPAVPALSVGGNLEFRNGSIGKDAKFVINGLETSRSANTFTIDNVTYTLHKDNSSANISLSSDTDNMVDKIVKFVDKYNEMIEKINGKLTESRYRSYKPLSNEEKEGMSEKQIELWEERAKSGLIKNDSILTSTLSKMRLDFYNPVSGSSISQDFSQLAQIGIKTTKSYMEKGKLSIENVDKLREAIEKDPNAVFQLFNADGKATADKGIAKRLRDTIKTTIGNIEEKAGKQSAVNNQFAIGRNLERLDSQINRFESRLVQIEDRYWRQFTAMEKAIQRSNSQSSYLMQQFS
ncbi:flagellar hook-associated protein 2 [Metabacillus fastidiosus]|uniref:flagellar hook-associated protein 2 n=1 Tax=Metabacillus fastidiosus TaxID=1458 RepID=UPI002E1C93F1|nr:flagellar hook-associated protein 2 [Metabacillus fastidiosus]